MTPQLKLSDDPRDFVLQLAQVGDARERRKLLLAHKQRWNPQLVELLYDETVRLARVDLQHAGNLAQAAAWVGERLGDDRSRALGLRSVGHIFYLQSKYETAWERYQAALALYERMGEEIEVGRTINGSLHALIYLGRYDQALACARRAREIFSRQGDHLRLARLDANMGNILHRQDRFEDALALYQRAHSAFLTIGTPQDLAVALRNMAVCYISLNDFRQALETYGQARAHCEKHGMPLLVAEADYNIAYLYYLRGEYTRAIELYRAARVHCQAVGDAYHSGLCDLDQAEMYLELNLTEEGAQLARRAYDCFRKLGTGYETAKALTNMAIASNQQGDARRALDLFRQARDLFTREQNPVWTALIDLYQALVLYQGRRLEEAWTLCQRSFDFFSPSLLHGKAALCQLLLARIHLDAGRGEEARRTCLLALERLEQAETPALTYQAWFVLGTIEEALGSPDAAYQAYLHAHERLENLRSHLKAEELKIAFLKDKLAVYESLVWMCLSRLPHDAAGEAAFNYIEQAKSRSLADLIAFRAHNQPSASHTHRALSERARSLREELTWYSRGIEIAEARNTIIPAPILQKFKIRARECEKELVEALANLRAGDQEFASLQAAGCIGLEEIRSALSEDAVLLQYFQARDTIYVCLLGRRLLKTVPLGPASEARRSLRLLRFQLARFRMGPRHVRAFHGQLLANTQAHLRDLHRQLIQPILDDLRAEHLIVAPHGFLHYLPFHALLDGTRSLGDRFSISYTPSASVYYLCCTKKVRAGDHSLVLGVPDPSAPHIQDEVNAVASSLPHAEVFLGAEATQDLLRYKGADSRYVHIATHGFFRQDNPMFSSIRLGNSQLSLFDLYQLNLSSELVTLSGCGTGLNVVVGGDELLGLVRGLLYAGAQGVLVTLWDVNDQSTAEFMKRFYRQLGTCKNKAVALQKAMQEIREAYPHAYYWAPFVLVGKYQ
ncbi:MAG: CHAT domain-containing protein [Acidobacteria bacterium]|nr:CHAT domain-containing protein [Acidobacteriota bacterium]